MESNVGYIKNILEAFEISKYIVNDKDGSELNLKIYDIIYDKEYHIQYIVDEERYPEFTREVCLSITSKDIKLVEIRIKDYHDRLKEIFKILQNLIMI